MKRIDRKDGTTVIEYRYKADSFPPCEVGEFAILGFDPTTGKERTLQADDEGVLLCTEDHRPVPENRRQEPYYRLRLADEGVPGNTNPNIRRYHGWRGTTQDRALYALGYRRVLESRPVTRGQGWRVVLSADFRADCE